MPEKFVLEPESDAAKALRSIRDNLEYMIEYGRLRARIHRAKYEELLKLGFSETQALELCKEI